MMAMNPLQLVMLYPALFSSLALSHPSKLMSWQTIENITKDRKQNHDTASLRRQT